MTNTPIDAKEIIELGRYTIEIKARHLVSDKDMYVRVALIDNERKTRATKYITNLDLVDIAHTM